MSQPYIYTYLSMKLSSLKKTLNEDKINFYKSGSMPDSGIEGRVRHN